MKGRVLVAGAGHVGLYAACAFAGKGFEVHLFDQLDESGVIRRYAWADSIEPYAVEALGLPVPIEVNGRLQGELVKKTPDPGSEGVFQYRRSSSGDYLIDRGGLTIWQINQARKAGVHLHFSSKVKELLGILGPELEDIDVTGFSVQEEGTERVYQADLVIDATGIDAVLRRQLIPEVIGKKTDLPQFSSFKSVRRFKGTITPGETHFPFQYMGHMNLEGVRGYTWMSRLGEDVVDLGCCIEVFEPDGGETARKIGLAGIESFPPLAEGQILIEGSGVMPCGSAPDTFVAGGFAAVGDSAVMTDEIGRGITGGIQAGTFLVDNLVKKQDFTIAGLWPAAYRWYNEKGLNRYPAEWDKALFSEWKIRVCREDCYSMAEDRYKKQK